MREERERASKRASEDQMGGRPIGRLSCDTHATGTRTLTRTRTRTHAHTHTHSGLRRPHPSPESLSLTSRDHGRARARPNHTCVAPQMMSNLDADLSGNVSLAEWLVFFKASADKSEDATRKMLELYDEHLKGRPARTSSRRRDMMM